MSVISFVTVVHGASQEIRGKHLQYSKFWSITNAQKRIPSKRGMILGYTPAFLLALASFWILPNQSFRFMLLKSVLTLHFFKRIFEVLFIHKYSGNMALDTAILIPLCYLSNTATIVYAQNLTQTFPEPPIDLLYPGMALFLVGISGNFYHHYLLSKLRAKDEKEYKIPKGGLFDLVICPHYLFEIIESIGVSFISQTLPAFIFSISSGSYLMGQSISTRRWYISKFEDFPKDVKAIIPFVL
ncbi:hypothetical protein L6164_005621 [Bauhinia variegata]|uniref:Uncharacterized protein n=1 Tax=Bauhinia variegata TaxID=167791 RepID=A0ACB9PX99_BAUVA|nr:hypothetical protein L6164_005621 [Bauhinia variegata]